MTWLDLSRAFHQAHVTHRARIGKRGGRRKSHVTRRPAASRIPLWTPTNAHGQQHGPQMMTRLNCFSFEICAGSNAQSQGSHAVDESCAAIAVLWGRAARSAGQDERRPSTTEDSPVLCSGMLQGPLRSGIPPGAATPHHATDEIRHLYLHQLQHLTTARHRAIARGGGFWERTLNTE